MRRDASATRYGPRAWRCGSTRARCAAATHGMRRSAGKSRTVALFVPVISANTQSRSEGYFRLEWKLAVDRSHQMADDQAFLLPVVIDATLDANARVPEKFRDVQWTHLSTGTSAIAFAEHVHRLLSGGAASAPVALLRAAPPTASATAAVMQEPPSIAVLPFVNRSRNVERATYLGDRGLLALE